MTDIPNWQKVLVVIGFALMVAATVWCVLQVTLIPMGS